MIAIAAAEQITRSLSDGHRSSQYNSRRWENLVRDGVVIGEGIILIGLVRVENFKKSSYRYSWSVDICFSLLFEKYFSYPKSDPIGTRSFPILRQPPIPYTSHPRVGNPANRWSAK